jgi:ABC-type amino acid transport substrate-binding protein
MSRSTIVLALLAALLALPAMANDLVPTGTLRATYIATNPVQAFVDPATKEVRGPGAEIARALAQQLGVPLDIKGAPGVPGVIDSVKKGEADIGFVAYDPVRAVDVDFSQTYSLAQNTYLVLQTSPLRRKMPRSCAIRAAISRSRSNSSTPARSRPMPPTASGSPNSLRACRACACCPTISTAWNRQSPCARATSHFWMRLRSCSTRRVHPA